VTAATACRNCDTLLADGQRLPFHAGNRICSACKAVLAAILSQIAIAIVVGAVLVMLARFGAPGSVP
jgi:hypothetical protein